MIRHSLIAQFPLCLCLENCEGKHSPVCQLAKNVASSYSPFSFLFYWNFCWLKPAAASNWFHSFGLCFIPHFCLVVNSLLVFSISFWSPGIFTKLGFTSMTTKTTGVRVLILAKNLQFMLSVFYLHFWLLFWIWKLRTETWTNWGGEKAALIFYLLILESSQKVPDNAIKVNCI
jgi:hypothetical protein